MICLNFRNIGMLMMCIFFILCDSNKVYSQQNVSNGVRVEENSKFDSLDLKITAFVDKKQFQKAAAVMLEKGKLFFDSGMYINASTVLDNAINILYKCKDTNNVEFGDVYVECLNYKGVSYCYMSDFNRAMQCYVKIEKYNKGNNLKYAIKAYNGMGVVFAMNNNNILAEEYYRKALSIAKKVPDYNLFSVYSNLGAVFMAKLELDSALAYFLDAHKIAVSNKERTKEIVSLQSLGMINFQLNKYNLALKYFNEACDIAVEEGNYNQLSYLKFNMISNYIALGDYEMAYKIANEALNLAKLNNSKVLEYTSLLLLSQIYENQGSFKKSLDCLRTGLKIKDSLFNNESENKLLNQKIDFDMYRIQSEQALSESNIALESANRRINNMIVWFVIGLLMLVLYFVSYKLIRLYKINKSLNSQIDDIRFDDANRHSLLKEEIESKNRELTSTSLLIVKFNELSFLLNNKLRILKANLSQKSKDMEIVRDMEELIAQFAPEKSWDEFKHYFEQISPEFYDKLDILYPDITLGEKRLCALMSLSLTSKEIASITGKSSGAIDNAKSRIRKKMRIGPEINLNDILSQFK